MEIEIGHLAGETHIPQVRGTPGPALSRRCYGDGMFQLFAVAFWLIVTTVALWLWGPGQRLSSLLFALGTSGLVQALFDLIKKNLQRDHRMTPLLGFTLRPYAAHQ
jgi:hypothetical protein